jgi:hypothetical protein
MTLLILELSLTVLARDNLFCYNADYYAVVDAALVSYYDVTS